MNIENLISRVFNFLECKLFINHICIKHEILEFIILDLIVYNPKNKQKGGWYGDIQMFLRGYQNRIRFHGIYCKGPFVLQIS